MEETVVADSSQETGTTQNEGSAQEGFDVESASDNLANDLFEKTESEASIDLPEETAETAEEITPETVVQAKPAPKTWPKEMHEHWAKTPPAVQEYWETREKQMLDGLEQYKGAAAYGKQMHDVINPYMATIQAAGVNPPQAVQYLLNAHQKLSTGSPAQKAELFRALAKDYGIDVGGTGEAIDTPQVDPMVRQLQEELHSIKQTLQGSAQAQTAAERERIGKEVNSFASDAAHPYFDEVADDIVVMLKSGASLQDAYEKAVWANPVTRAKEMARLQQEQVETNRKAALDKAAAAKKAASVNIQNRDTRRAPTETKRATMRNLDDALQESMREIRSTH